MFFPFPLLIQQPHSNGMGALEALLLAAPTSIGEQVAHVLIVASSDSWLCNNQSCQNTRES